MAKKYKPTHREEEWDIDMIPEKIEWFHAERKMLMYLFSNYSPNKKYIWKIFLYSEKMFCASCRRIITDICGHLTLENYSEFLKLKRNLPFDPNTKPYFHSENRFIALCPKGSSKEETPIINKESILADPDNIWLREHR